MHDQRKVKGYDHAFLLQAKGDRQPARGTGLVCRTSKLQMTVYTSAPAPAVLLRQLSRRHPGTRDDGCPTADWQGLALESEFLPGFSPNHPEWPQPDCVLRPGEEYVSLTEYQFHSARLIDSALHQGALFFVPALPSAASFISSLLYFPSPKDKNITL